MPIAFTGCRWLPFIAVGALVASCTRVSPPPANPPPPVVAPQAGVRYVLDTDQSVLRVYVHRGGTLAALGHNHVLVVRRVEGSFELPQDAHAVSGALSFAVEGFSVDEPAERAQAGADFPGVIAAADIAGTRHNLLGPGVLDAVNSPQVVVEFAGARGGPDDYVVSAKLTVRGVPSAAEVPLHLARDGVTLTADGTAMLSQTQLGLTPFSILLGALKVEDALQVRFHLVGRPAI